MNLATTENTANPEGASVQDRLVELIGGEPTPEEESQQAEAAPAAEIEEEPIEEEEAVEATVEDDEETSAPTEEAESQLSISDLAATLGIDEQSLDVSDDGELVFLTKADGEEVSAKFADLVTGYQLKGHLNNQNMEVQELKKSLQAETEKLESDYAQKQELAENAIQLAMQHVMGDFNATDWDELRVTDPGEYAAKQQEYQQQIYGLQNQLQQLQEQKYHVDPVKQQEYLQSEAQKLKAAVPEWQDEKVAQKGMSDVIAYAKQAGYQDQSLAAANSLDFITLRKAMLYDKLQTESKDVVKKVKKAPKIVKPGAAVNKKTESQKHIESLRIRAKKTGGKNGSIADLLLATGKV